MRRLRSVMILLVAAAPALADPAILRTGTDTFVSPAADQPLLEAPGDVFATGASVVLRGLAGGDVHAAGFSLEIELPAPQDLYAMGGSVMLRGPVGGDLAAAGFSLRLSDAADVSGNARLSGGSVTVDGDIGGALTAAGGSVALNAAVGGDVVVQTGDLSFGPAARIGGRLTYAAPAPVSIPATVIPAERVAFRRSGTAGEMRDWHDGWGMRPFPVLPAFLTLFWGWLVTLGFLVAVAAVALAVAPDLTERLRASTAARPGAALLTGFLGLATLVGLIPVAAMTILGLPLVPVAVLAILLLWTLGYLAGAHALATRLRDGAGMAGAGLGTRLVLIAAVVAALSLLNFIPVAGWLVNLAVMLAGLGAILRPLFHRLGSPLPEAPPAA